MERITDDYVFFWGSEFSNWYTHGNRSEFKYRGLTFFNSEQAFMWEKAVFFGDINAAEDIVKYGQDPRTAKDLGRSVKKFNAKKWSEVCYYCMVDVNYAKYSQSPVLKDLLLSTENKTLVETSPTDSIWGIGLHWSDDRVLDEAQWQGQNLLGKALMEVRDKLKKDGK